MSFGKEFGVFVEFGVVCVLIETAVSAAVVGDSGNRPLVESGGGVEPRSSPGWFLCFLGCFLGVVC